jgi:hypothetical protein
MKYILLLFISFNICAETVLFKKYLYVVKSGNIKLAWDAAEGASFYEVRACWVDPDPMICYQSARCFDTQYEFKFKRAGHFIFQVRSGNFNTNTNQEQFSERWASTDNDSDALVDSENKGFFIYFKLPSPDIIIE